MSLQTNIGYIQYRHHGTADDRQNPEEQSCYSSVYLITARPISTCSSVTALPIADRHWKSILAVIRPVCSFVLHVTVYVITWPGIRQCKNTHGNTWLTSNQSFQQKAKQHWAVHWPGCSSAFQRRWIVCAWLFVHQIVHEGRSKQAYSGTATVGVVGVLTPSENQVGVSNTATILVYLVTCNWLLNCTAGVFRSFCFYRAVTTRQRSTFHLKMYRSRLAGGLCAPQTP